MGRITALQGHPIRDFDGYIDRKESQKKIGRDIFKRGDSAFLSGDLLEMDELGYLYFVDRLGDTFRWHGENVSTAEVEATIGKVAGLKDCTVYGVKVRRCSDFRRMNIHLINSFEYSSLESTCFQSSEKLPSSVKCLVQNLFVVARSEISKPFYALPIDDIIKSVGKFQLN